MSLFSRYSALTLHAASGRFAPFFVFRILLGIFEACVAPILIALIASFYKKSEQARRIGFFYAMNGVTYIVGGAIAYGQVSPRRGRRNFS